MSALLEERAKQQQNRNSTKSDEHSGHPENESNAGSLRSLVESVKRKSAMSDAKRTKRRKL